MKNTKAFAAALLTVGIAFVGFSSAPARADKPEWAGKGRGHQEERDRDRDHGRNEYREERHHEGHFGDRGRLAVRTYYGEQERHGRCPPGLAKKHNGCMPPGQVRRWEMGRPLPRDVVVYDVPPQLVVQIGVPPSGYKYVRAAGDILMVAVGTSMVVDAIQDLGR